MSLTDFRFFIFLYQFTHEPVVQLCTAMVPRMVVMTVARNLRTLATLFQFILNITNTIFMNNTNNINEHEFYE